MADSTFTIPDETKKRFGDLIELILQSESMNSEERQYWINILPVMTTEQIQNLRDILENEKAQLKAIDEKYAKEIEKIGDSQKVAQTGTDRQKKREERQSKEALHEKEEEKQTESILQEIDQQ